MVRFFLILVSFSSLLSAYPPFYFYNIDATLRGEEIYRAFQKASAGGSAIYSTPGPTTTQEVAIQTTSLQIQKLFGLTIPNFITNGLVSYVQGMTPASNYTLFILSYYPPSKSPPVLQYLVVGIEQITDIFYTSYNSNKTPPISTSGYTSTFSSNVLPFYNINTASRAADIVSIVSTMINSAPYITQNPTSEVWIQTTLNGTFYPDIQNGFIPDIQSLSVLNNSLIQIFYKTHQQNNIGSLIVSAEQVQQIYYYPTRPTP